ncbi:MAG: hypothetical protein AAGJ87_09110 [Pseudomonadota bacterium]
MTEKKGVSRVDLNSIAAGAAIVVSVAALFVAWDQAQIMRRQQHAAFWPVVNLQASLSSTDASHDFTIVLANDGVGPARVQSSALTLAGVDVRDWPSFEAGLPAPLRGRADVNLGTSVGVLAPGEEDVLFEIAWPWGPETDAAFTELKRIVFNPVVSDSDFEICYCSVFDRCWIVNGDDGGAPKRVAQCADGTDITLRMLQTLPTGAE